MATARYNRDYEKVVLRLSHEEAAALYALLARVGPETHEGIDEMTFDVFAAMQALAADGGPYDFGAIAKQEYGEFMRKAVALADQRA
jgi:hypothetical protein